MPGTYFALELPVISKVDPIARGAAQRVSRVSRFLGGGRWLFMPFGLVALVMMGVHAAADTVDDRFLWLIDHVDSMVDAVLASWSPTRGLVDVVGAPQRTMVSRVAALLWELTADALLLWPVLGYREEDKPRLDTLLTTRSIEKQSWRALFERLRAQPTLLRIALPLVTLFVVIAGAVAVAKMVQGAVYLGSISLLGSATAGIVARAFAWVSLAAVLFSLGWRSVLRTVQYADEIARAGTMTRRRRLTEGLWTILICAPLAIAALLFATPLMSFFR